MVLGERREMDLIERIDEARGRWNVLEHPFYQCWERGELTREELAHYAGEYRHAVVALANAAAAAGDPEHAEEEAAHIALWDDFAAALDAPLDREPAPETRDCADAWQPEDPLEARAVLYAVESGQPDISRTKLAGLVEHYGFDDGGPGTEYFSLHADRDHEHAAASKRVLEEPRQKDADRLVAAAEAALEGNWRLLDGVSSKA
jgi:pyrroloquinoline-quinone synthase